jgi:hypothetical protein
MIKRQTLHQEHASGCCGIRCCKHHVYAVDEAFEMKNAPFNM